MKTPSIFAKSITNLTDARYFAAMGVDYIGFELSAGDPEHVDIEFVKRVKEWLEGPEIIGCVSGKETINELTKWVVDGELDGLYFHSYPGEEVLNHFGTITIFIETDLLKVLELPSHKIKIVVDLVDLNKNFDRWQPAIEEFTTHNKMFIKGDFDDAYFKSSFYQWQAGMILSGSEEEKVGFKSFEDLDNIFEKLDLI